VATSCGQEIGDSISGLNYFADVNTRRGAAEASLIVWPQCDKDFVLHVVTSCARRAVWMLVHACPSNWSTIASILLVTVPQYGKCLHVELQCNTMLCRQVQT